MSELTLEVVEGPDAGRTIALTGPVEIGRDPSATLTLADTQVSRHHARVTPHGMGAAVEDLGSSNGTFVNSNELHGSVAIDPGDQLLIGVSVLTLRSSAQVLAQPSAVLAVPPGLARDAQRPTFTDKVRGDLDTPKPAQDPGDIGSYGKLGSYVDSNVKLRAKLAPLAIFLLVVLIVVIYLGTR